MKLYLLLLSSLFISNALFAQNLKSGEYGSGLKIAMDSSSNLLTGYYENYTGWDEDLQSPRFSCVFYLIGTTDDGKVTINTFNPEEQISDEVPGEIMILSDSTFSIKLEQEHGGCWNVWHFADQFKTYNLNQVENWTQIRYVDADKTYFHSSDSEQKRLKSYVVKGDFVKVLETKGAWSNCVFEGTKTTKGWIKTAHLNKL